MDQVKNPFRRRLRVALAATAVCASLLGFSGCSFSDEGYITHGDARLGEWTYADYGVLVVLYRTTGGHSYNFPTTEMILGIYRSYRDQQYSEPYAAMFTLREMRKYCGGSGYAGDRCRDATGDDEWDDFLYDSLVPVIWRPGECIAVHFRSGENWTTRNSGDTHCIPD